MTMMCANSREDWTKIEGGEAKKRVSLKFKMAENRYHRKLTSYGVLNSSRPRESNGTSFLKIGHAVHK